MAVLSSVSSSRANAAFAPASKSSELPRPLLSIPPAAAVGSTPFVLRVTAVVAAVALAAAAAGLAP